MRNVNFEAEISIYKLYNKIFKNNLPIMFAVFHKIFSIYCFTFWLTLSSLLQQAYFNSCFYTLQNFNHPRLLSYHTSCLKLVCYVYVFFQVISFFHFIYLYCSYVFNIIFTVPLPCCFVHCIFIQDVSSLGQYSTVVLWSRCCSITSQGSSGPV